MYRVVKFKNAGKLSYEKALALQIILVHEHLKYKNEWQLSASPILDSLLIVEHPPVYTIGMRTANYKIEDEEKLKNLGAEFYRTNRGGLITFHGPGQLVAYPILNLDNYKKSLKWYVHNLEATLIDTCKAFGVKASTCEHTGVWVNEHKIAAIGIHAKRFITSHGIALNCNVDLDWFNHIVPCGIADRGVTSLSKELNRDVTISEAIPRFASAFQTHFDCKLIEETENISSKSQKL